MTEKKMKLGLIPGVAKEALQEDWDGALKRLADMGYEGVEMSMGTLEQSGMSAADCRTSLESHGLEAMSFFAGWGPFDTEAEDHIQAAQDLGCDYMVWGWSPCDESDQMAKVMPVMHKAASMVKSAGMQLLYHNHDHEFKNRVKDQAGFDWLMGAFHRELLESELDVGWVAYGGRDVVATIEQYAGRCPILHMRDVGNPDERGKFIEIGNGVLDIAGIIRAGYEKGGSDWAIVEHSRNMEHESFEGLQIAADNLRQAIDGL